MTIDTSTNALDWAADTNRRPVFHRIGASMSGADDMDLSPSRIDAVVAAPSWPIVEKAESTSSASLQQGAEQPTAVSQSTPMAPKPYVLPVPPAVQAPYAFRLLQQWEGTVTELAEEEFTAELRDLTDPANYREEATFDLDEVSPDDLSLLALGAVFRWSIGYRTSAAGQRERVSQLRFVRIPGWRRSAVAEIKQRAAELQQRFPLV